MDIMATIAERKITEALARGELDNLAGAGKPLAMDEDHSAFCKSVPSLTILTYS